MLKTKVTEPVAGKKTVKKTGMLGKKQSVYKLSDHVFRDAWDMAFDARRITDYAGTTLYVNDSFCELFGLSREEVIGKSFTIIYAEPERERLMSAQKEMVEKASSARLFEEEAILWNGKAMWIEYGMNFTADKKGSGLIITFLRDISERKNAQKSQRCLYKISESVNTTKDIDALYYNIHQTVKELMPANNFYIALYDDITEMLSFPYYVDEYDTPPEPKKLGKGMTEYVLRTGRDILASHKAFQRLIESGEIKRMGSPSKIWLGVALRVFDRIIGVMAVQDYRNEFAYGEREKEILIFVSEQVAFAIEKKRTEDELLLYTVEMQESKLLLEKKAAELSSLNDQLEQSNASKDKFFSILAHDLRSPFNGLLGFANILLEDIDRLPKEDIKNFVVQINGATKSIYSLLENILQWSRMQIGRMDYQPIKINLYENINYTFNLLIGNAIKKNIVLECEVDDKIYVNADQNMLNSIIQNLVSNAIKFTESGGNVKVMATVKGKFVEISVADSGVGIKKEDMVKLFRIDAKHSTIGTAKERGTGLGLILCKELVEKHGGSIWVESKAGKGTCFNFALPHYGN